MKRTFKINRDWRLPICLAAGLALASFMTANAADEPPTLGKGGATLLMKGRPLVTATDASNLQQGDLVVMSCPKCKNVTVTTVTMEKGHIPHAVTSEVHQCPGCRTKLVTTGHGKMKETKIVHVCPECGSKGAYCCVVSPSQKSTDASPSGTK